MARTCDVEGCEKPHLAKGLCSGHRWQMQHHGQTTSLGPRNAGRPKVAEPTYSAMHKRVASARGLARDHVCQVASCGLMADQWAYSHRDRDERTETVAWNGVPRQVSYSLDVDQYVPLCRSHHISMDRYGLSLS